MKTKFFLTLLILAIFSSFIFNSCSTKKRAKGLEDEIIVFSDSLEYLEVKNALKETFGKIIYTPQPEEFFTLERRDVKDLEKLKFKKNIIIIAPINSGSQVSNFLSSIIDSNAIKMILTNEAFVINKYNLWAEDQLVMILTSPSLELLNKNNLDKKDDLLYFFRETSNKRLAKGLYNSKYEQKNVQAHLLDKYGWMIYVQADYQLSVESPDDNFVWLRRGINTDIEKWIFIHWIEKASPEFLNVDSIGKERNKLTEKFYRTSNDSAYVIYYDDYKMDSEVNFNGRYAILTQGLWRFNDQSMGGPFISYTFYDIPSKRIYMLDASILAPKYFKKSLIQQVDVLLHSFQTEDEIDSVKKKIILDKLDQ